MSNNISKDTDEEKELEGKDQETLESKKASTINENTRYGFPNTCNRCGLEMSSLKIIKHAGEVHRKDGTVCSVSKAIPPTPDSVYNNINPLSADLVLVDENGM